LKSKKRLAKLLYLGREKLETLAQSSDDLYREFYLGSRLIEAPDRLLKGIQRRIDHHLKRIEVPNYLHAPATERSYVTNAQAHSNSKKFVSLDIQKYFPSTPSWRVYKFFHDRMKCSADVAAILTNLSTYKEHLPTGSPLSPTLSYFSYMNMWEAINEMVEVENCILTVYMDDVTISGVQVPGNLVWQVRKQFHRYGLRDNQKKERKSREGKPYRLTGVIVNKNELMLPNKQHMKAHEIRQQISSETEKSRRSKLARRLKGLEAQAQHIKTSNTK
jgi:retron-type reverse transcriptase